MRLEIKDVSEHTILEIAVSGIETVAVVKTRIESATQIPVSYQRLFYLGDPIDDSHFVSLLQDALVLIERKCVEGKLQLYIKTLTGSVFDVHVGRHDKVRDLIRMLDKRDGFTQFQSRYFFVRQFEFSGVVLARDKQLHEYGVVDESMLQMLFKL